MRNCKRNRRKMYYALYDSKKMIYDDEGDPTFEYEEGYDNPVEFEASLSAGKSESEHSPFGNDVNYDRTILSFDMELPIDENSLIWVKNEPEYDEGKVVPDSADYKVAAPVIDGLRSLKIAIRYNK